MSRLASRRLLDTPATLEVPTMLHQTPDTFRHLSYTTPSQPSPILLLTTIKKQSCVRINPLISSLHPQGSYSALVLTLFVHLRKLTSPNT